MATDLTLLRALQQQAITVEKSASKCSQGMLGELIWQVFARAEHGKRYPSVGASTAMRALAVYTLSITAFWLLWETWHIRATMQLAAQKRAALLLVEHEHK